MGPTFSLSFLTWPGSWFGICESSTSHSSVSWTAIVPFPCSLVSLVKVAILSSYVLFLETLACIKRLAGVTSLPSLVTTVVSHTTHSPPIFRGCTSTFQISEVLLVSAISQLSFDFLCYWSHFWHSVFNEHLQELSGFKIQHKATKLSIHAVTLSTGHRFRALLNFLGTFAAI